MYSMKSERHQCLEVETSEKSESSFGSTASTGEETSQDSSECDSSLEVCGIKGPSENGGESSQKRLNDEDLEKMLAKDLYVEEKEDKVMLRRYTSLFIFDYGEITGVTAVQHQINLKPNQKPVAQKLRRVGKFSKKLC